MWFFFITIETAGHYNLILGLAKSARMSAGSTAQTSSIASDIMTSFKKISKKAALDTKEYLKCIRYVVAFCTMDLSFLAIYAYGYYGKVI